MKRWLCRRGEFAEVPEGLPVGARVRLVGDGAVVDDGAVGMLGKVIAPGMALIYGEGWVYGYRAGDGRLVGVGK